MVVMYFCVTLLRVDTPARTNVVSSDAAIDSSCPASPDSLVFICLAIVPSRAHLIENLVSALLLQTYNADIILGIPNVFSRNFSEGEDFALRATVEKCASISSRIHVVRGRDTGPSSKLLLPLTKLLDSSIILVIVDDDQIYSPSAVCDLLVAEYVHPGRAIARMSRNLPRYCEEAGNYSATVHFSEASAGNFGTRILHDCDIIMGTSSYLVRASFFGPALFRYSICPGLSRKALFSNDDIWISAHLHLMGIQSVTVLSGHALLPDYVTAVPEIRRQLSGPDGLWKFRDVATSCGMALMSVSNAMGPKCDHTIPRCHFALDKTHRPRSVMQ